MYEQRESFANAPLALVACEVRFPLAPRLAAGELSMSLADAFSSWLPIPELIAPTPLSDAPHGGGSSPVLRILNKARTASVILTGRSLVAEVTDYTGWQGFKPKILRAIETVAEMANIVGVERVGLRYINEIRVPEEISDASEWKGWIHDDLLQSFDPVSDYTLDSFQTITVLEGEKVSLMIRSAALVGKGIVSNDPLIRPVLPVEGPFFVIDIDSYIDTPNEQMLNFEPEVLSTVLDELHSPVGTVFQFSITEKLRRIFRSTS